MADRPEKEVLLDAVARFLDKEVRPAVSDPRLAFRLLIAANLNQIVATELRLGEAHEAAQLARLRALAGLPPPAPGSAADRAAELRRLERDLARRIREEPLDDDARRRVREHVIATLRERLAVSNPRFDLASAIE